MFERFTEKAIKVVTQSQQEAKALKHSKLYPEHLLLGILNQPSGITSKFLKAAGVKPDTLREKINLELKSKKTDNIPEILPFSEEVKKILTRAWDKARTHSTGYITPEHLFLSLMKEDNASILKLLSSYDVDIERIQSTVRRVVEKDTTVKTHPEGTQKTQIGSHNPCAVPSISEEANISELITSAKNKVQQANYEALGTEQFLQAMLENKDSDLCRFLTSENITSEAFNQKLEEKNPRLCEYNDKELLFTPKSYSALNLAYEAAKELGSATITPEHVLLGILRSKDGAAYKTLKNMGVNTEDLHDKILKPIEKQKPVTLTILRLAKEESRRLGHNIVGTELILLGILGEGTATGAKVLKELGVTVKDARHEVEKIIGYGDEYQEKEITYTPRAKKLLEAAWNNAKKFNKQRIGSEHLLLGITKEKDCIAMKVLENLGVDVVEIRQGILKEIDKKDIVEE